MQKQANPSGWMAEVEARKLAANIKSLDYLLTQRPGNANIMRQRAESLEKLTRINNANAKKFKLELPR